MRRVLTNSAFNSSKQIVAIAIAFVVSPIVVRSLGDESYGLWSLIVSITGYYSILEFGVASAVVKYVSQFVAVGDRKRAKEVYATASLFYFAVSLFVFGTSLIVGVFFPRWFEVSVLSPTGVLVIVVILGLDLALRILFSGVAASLFALQEIRALSVVDITANVLKNGVLVALLFQGYGLVMMAVVTLVAGAVRAVALRWALARRHSFLRFERGSFSREVLRTVVTYSSASFVIMIASKLMFYSNSVIVGKVVSIGEVTYYSIAASLLVYVEAVIWSMLQVLIPVISSQDATGNRAANQRLYLVGSRYSTLLALPILLTLFSIGEVFIANWMGPEYGPKCGLVLRILIVGYSFRFSQFAAEVMLRGINRHRGLAVILIGTAVADILLSIALASTYGINGVAVGTALPLVVAYLLAVPAYTCRVLGLSLWRFFRSTLAVPAGLVAVFALVAPAAAAHVSNYFDIMLFALGVTSYVAVGAWFLAIEEGHRAILVDTVRRRLGV